MKIRARKLKRPHIIWNINGTQNKVGTIKTYMDLLVQTGEHQKNMQFLVMDLGEDELVLGYPWLAAFNPKIDWKNSVLHEDMQPLVTKTLDFTTKKEVKQIRDAWIKKAQTRCTDREEIFV